MSQQASGDQQPASSSTATGELSSVPQQITRQQIHYAFSIMDNNNDGLIDLRDLSQMLANLGVPIDEAILSHVMSSASKRGEYLSETFFGPASARYLAHKWLLQIGLPVIFDSP